LLEKLRLINFETNLSTSYDFQGRGYAGKINSLFARNLKEFKEYIYTIGFVLTSPAIENFLNNHDPYFEMIYKDYTLYFDYYVPEENNCDVLMPSDEELYNAFIYTATHYPNIYPVKDWVENLENKMTCYSLNKLTVLPNGEHVTCRYLSYKKGSFENDIEYKSNSNIITSYIDKNECLSCEWYDRCSLRCFVQADWVKREKMDMCLYKKFFNEIIVD
jgi:radical SAM protein with 4Fe4S-binding SPASM domain